MRDALYKVKYDGIIAKYDPAFEPTAERSRLDPAARTTSCSPITRAHLTIVDQTPYAISVAAKRSARSPLRRSRGHLKEQAYSRPAERASMVEIFQYLLNGLTIGGIYALVAPRLLHHVGSLEGREFHAW